MTNHAHIVVMLNRSRQEGDQNGRNRQHATNYGAQRGGGDRGASTREEQQDDEDIQQDDGEYLMPDRDFYRRKITSFQNVHSYFAISAPFYSTI